MANYVKFMRGSLEAYNALQTKDLDTLYFITDSENKTNLYLGGTVISNSTSNLSPEAQDFLNNLPASNEINDGELQIWVGPEEIEKIDPETGETLVDEETGEPITETIPGHWATKSIDEVIPLFNAASAGGAGLVAKPAAGQENRYLRGDGSWVDLNETVIQNVITQIVGEGQLDEQFDTLKEISDWILNDTTGAAALQARLVALEQATGVGQTEKVTTRVQTQLFEGEEGEEVPVYWNIEPGTPQTTDITDYPIYINNPDYIEGGDEPEFIQDTDINTGDSLYWDIDEQPGTTTTPGAYLAFIEQDEITEVPIPNDVENLKSVVSDLNLRVGHIESSIFDNNGDLVFIDSQVGNLDNLLLKNEETATDEGDPSTVVEAINILDNRTRWIEL